MTYWTIVMVCALPLVMSNILPKKRLELESTSVDLNICFYSWHVYNDKNREKVKKDEASARIEKEKSEERSKAAEREHRLTILRSRASIASESPKGDSKNSSRFKLFNESEGNQVSEVCDALTHSVVIGSFKRGI